MNAAPAPIVLDTNIVLDVFVFSDAAALPVLNGLQAGELAWLATRAMRDELARVLDYPQISKRRAFYKVSVDDVLAAFDKFARLVEAAPKARVTCSDPDDQKFIDLAVAHQSLLLSKDKAVISMQKGFLSREYGHNVLFNR